MNERVRLFWAARTERERQLLGVMAALFATVLVWLAILRPLAAARVRAEARLQSATADAALIATRAGALRGVRARAASTQPTQSLVGQSAGAAGFTLSRNDVQPGDRIAVSVVSARSPALFAWIAALDAQGIIVDRLTIRSNSDATLGVDAVFRRRAS